MCEASRRNPDTKHLGGKGNAQILATLLNYCQGSKCSKTFRWYKHTMVRSDDL